MRPLSELGIVQDLAGNYPTMPPSQDEVFEFEKEIGARLPSTYITLLNFKNGGQPDCNIVIPVSDSLKPYQDINVIYFLNSDKDSLMGVWQNLFILRNALGPGFFSFAHDLGGNPYFMRACDPGGSIWMAYHDTGLKKHLVANTFEDFIDSLLPFRDLPKVDPAFELGPDGRPRLKPEFLEDDDDNEEPE